MNVRLAACEPCRQAKVACGHEQPTCSRCHAQGRNVLCVYRARPFRRRPRDASEHEPSRPSHNIFRKSPSNSENVVPESQGGGSNSPRPPRRYPNPGFLGMSSHSTIFNQMLPLAASNDDPMHCSVQHSTTISTPLPLLDEPGDWSISAKAAHALHHLDQLNVPNLVSLVQSWLGKGVNLPLAEPFVVHCSEAVAEWHGHYRLSDARSGEQTMQRIETLLRNTHKPIIVQPNSTISGFISQITGTNLRWETLGIFLAAATRAALDTTSFTPLFTGDETRRRLIKALTNVGDFCLEICLALDCLNDLQLVLQYENFIVHSQVDGDQSYHSWRRMGDVASSLFALGYHEKIDDSISVPTFMAEIRKACFARIYAADKSLAVFLGRPPRIVKDYCIFQLPTNHVVRQDGDGVGENAEPSTPDPRRQGGSKEPDAREPINYTADTRCSALFGCLKEEVLQLLRKRRHIEPGSLSDLRLRVERQWEDLPDHFKLSTHVRDCHGSPFERDFLAGTRLDYLHIHFLLGLVSQRRMSEPDDSLLAVACEMLSITIEVIILRDRLVNSGTSLIWKVAQYGLPAAGIISLALLNPMSASSRNFSPSKVVQGLSILVAEITIGAWIQAGEPNFALFTRATGTIQSLLDSLTAWKSSAAPATHQSVSTDLAGEWDAYINSQHWEFEMNFWASLAEHPTLLNEIA